MRASDPGRTRLAALDNIEAMVAEDMAHHMARMVEEGWDVDGAVRSTVEWWESNMQAAMKRAVEANGWVTSWRSDWDAHLEARAAARSASHP
jgi:hypothetical protein